MIGDDGNDGVTTDDPGAVPGEAGERAGASTVYIPFNKGVSIPVTVDPSLVASLTNHYVELYGVNGYVAALIDTFDSHPDLVGTGEGKERYVRLLNLASQEELYHRHIESGVKGITVAEPILTWNEEKTGFVVHLTSEPEVTVIVDEGGEVHESQ